MFDPYNARTSLVRYILPLFVLVVMVVMLQMMLDMRSRASALKTEACEESDFRQQHVTPGLYRSIWKAALVEGTGADGFANILTATMLNSGFYPRQVRADSVPYRKYKPEEYERLMEAYQSVWSDLKYFPIPSTEVDFENTYGALRDYGGLRVHEGCDLFGRKKESGYYPVLSVTDGVVENIGWLPLGGYRIGIRAPKGGYFYYAHLDTYEKDFQTGEEVSAGDILGYMGNTGYGTEGTRGMFPVHLHLGIYIRTPHYEELSVNPYWVLKAISKKIRNYSY
jgi:murein DD-endopeptidase MepM/ murein hydrolase activator NlpD